MNIDENWKRIAGVHLQEDGTLGAVWLAHDSTVDLIHVYDACVFRREVQAVVIEGLNNRGRWIPIAWPKKAKEYADQLLERGVKVLPKPVEDIQEMAEVGTIEVWERMRTHRLKVDERLGEWREEFRTYQRHDSKVPLNTHPLMSATRHAVMSVQYGRRQSARRANQKNYPRLNIV